MPAKAIGSLKHTTGPRKSRERTAKEPNRVRRAACMRDCAPAFSHTTAMSITLPQPSQHSSLDGYIRALETVRIAALLQADGALLQQLHAAEYQLISPSGNTLSRERYLGLLASGELRYQRWDAETMAVRSSPAMALVRYAVTLQLGTPNEPGTPRRCWHTDSYELRGGQWQAVWSQATQIAG